MIFKPRKENGLRSARQALLVDPVVVSSHISVDERAYQIKLGHSWRSREHIVHRPLALPWRKMNEQRKRLRSPQRFTRRPLSKSCAEDLGSRPFSQDLQLKAIQHGVTCLLHAEIGGPHLC